MTRISLYEKLLKLLDVLANLLVNKGKTSDICAFKFEYLSRMMRYQMEHGVAYTVQGLKFQIKSLKENIDEESK